MDVNTLRTDLQHDVDHGGEGKVRAKRKKIGTTFKQYSGVKSPNILESSRFVLVQANLLSAIELDLTNLGDPLISLNQYVSASTVFILCLPRS